MFLLNTNDDSNEKRQKDRRQYNIKLSEKIVQRFIKAGSVQSLLRRKNNHDNNTAMFTINVTDFAVLTNQKLDTIVVLQSKNA